MPPTARKKPDPLLAAPKIKKDPLKVSSSTSVDLLTELSLARQKFDTDRQGNSSSAVARGPRPTKKTLWGTQNKGISLRNARDPQFESINTVTTNELAQSKRALERKAVEYERLKRGWSKDLTDTQKEEILVDFDSKYADMLLDEEFSEGEFDEPLVEMTDEFGRTRMVPQSRMPRPLTPESSLKPSNVIYGDYMPTFTPDEDKVWEINNREEKVEDVHYNPNAEVRNRGVGHYAFAADNTTRAEQMNALNTARDETEMQREATKKASELRRAKIDERRKEIANKKRKKEADKFLSGLELEIGPQLGGK